MALGVALVDRARVRTNVASNYRVEGSTVMLPTTGPEFRCRLTLPQAGKSAGAGGSRARVTKEPSLLLGLKALDGSKLELSVEDRVLVATQGNWETVEEWVVATDPEPLRKRKTVIGWFCSLRRVDDHERREIEPDAIRQPVGTSIRQPAGVTAHSGQVFESAGGARVSGGTGG